MSGITKYSVLVVFILSSLGCGRAGGLNDISVNPESRSVEQTIIDQTETLQDGAALHYKMNPGSYRLELTADNDGAGVEWLGGGCPPTKQSRVATMTCEMKDYGQLIVSNPTVFALGKAVTVRVRVVKLN
ncbi:MAG TPA: hypothetical protein PKM58_07935 [Pyrinomonadaceae bacterium]|nr:hypothetical protein [Pyrinomonadaceae bacterium]